MPSLPNVLATSKDDFITLIDRAENGTPAGVGWGVYKVYCKLCYHEWIAVALVGTKGMRCPSCEFYDTEHVWLAPSSTIGGDGAYLAPVGWKKASINLS